MKQEKRNFRIGEVYFMQFYGRDSEQNGRRPGIILQNNIGNKYSPNVIAIPLTSKTKKNKQPTHAYLPAKATGLPRDSVALCENPACISKELIGEYIVTLPDVYMEKVATAHLLATAAISFVKPDMLLSIWQQSYSLNEPAA